MHGDQVAKAGGRGFAVGFIPWSAVNLTDCFVIRLGGADISWIVGWVVAAAVYLLLMRARGEASVPGR